MNEKNVKIVTTPEELAYCEIEDVLHMDFGGYEGFIKVEEYFSNLNDCRICVFNGGFRCKLHIIFCAETIYRPDVVFKPLGR